MKLRVNTIFTIAMIVSLKLFIWSILFKSQSKILVQKDVHIRMSFFDILTNQN